MPQLTALSRILVAKTSRLRASLRKAVVTVLSAVALGVLGNFAYDAIKPRLQPGTETALATTREQSGKVVEPSPIGLRAPRKSCSPDWEACIGFENLVGLWRGKLPRGSLVHLSVEPPAKGDVVAQLSMESLSCRVQLRLAHVNDSMLTVSEFFFKPVERSKTCPEIEAVVLTPSATSSWFRLAMPDGSQTTIVVDKKIL